MSNVKLEFNIPIPVKQKAERERKYPFKEMEVGHTFFEAGVKEAAMKACISRFNKARRSDAEPEYKFEVRELTENGATGVRVWRTT